MNCFHVKFQEKQNFHPICDMFLAFKKHFFENKIFMKRATTIYLAKAVFSTYPEALTCQVNETYSTFHFENMEATSNFDFFLKRRHINPCKNNSNFDLVKNFVKSITLH